MSAGPDPRAGDIPAPLGPPGDPDGGDRHLSPADLVGLARAGRLRLPLPGGGRTSQRLAALHAWGRLDLTLARLVEAHTDAVAICAELGRPAPDELLGVWASESPGSHLAARPVTGGWRLDGAKAYCSGSRWVGHALVTARSGEGIELFLLAVDTPGVSFDSRGWVSPAFADTGTALMAVDGVVVAEQARVGPVGAYLSRPGFWHGALGVAACWAGGAAGLVDRVSAQTDPDPHAVAHLGAMAACVWSMRAALVAAARDTDADPADRAGAARMRALAVRHVVEQGCIEVVERFGRAAGPGPLAFDAGCARRVAELLLYVRQSHAERDLEALGRALVGGGRASSGGAGSTGGWDDRLPSRW